MFVNKTVAWRVEKSDLSWRIPRETTTVEVRRRHWPKVVPYAGTRVKAVSKESVGTSMHMNDVMC